MKEKLDYRKIGGDIVSDIVGSLLMGAGVYIFASGAGFAMGGVSGIALMLNYLFRLPMGAITLAINIPLIIISYRILGRNFIFKTFRTLAIQAVIYDYVCARFPVYEGDPLLAAFYTGALVGTGLGIIYIRDSSTGGSDLIMMSIRKFRPHMSMGQISLCIDGTIILCGVLVFGNINAVLYGVISMTVSTTMLDKIVAGTGSGKIAMVICEDGMHVAEAISNVAARGSTLIHGIGTYTEEGKDVVICACSKREVQKVRRSVYQVDPGAFVMVLSYDEAFGYGFKKPEQPEALKLMAQKAEADALRNEESKAAKKKENGK